MALFSLLFGAGILLFIERAQQREGQPLLLNLWRNVLLLGIGILHSLLWSGDVLVAYAISAVFLIALWRLPAKALIAVGAVVFLLSIPNFFLMQNIADTTDVSLAGLWEPGERNTEGLPGAMFGLALLGYFVRALGLILMGAGLYRLGFMQGSLASADLLADRRHRAGHWPAPGGRGRHRNGLERLLPGRWLSSGRFPTRWEPSRPLWAL